jgi:hypothetical protein
MTENQQQEQPLWENGQAPERPLWARTREKARTAPPGWGQGDRYSGTRFRLTLLLTAVLVIGVLILINWPR